MNLEKSVELDRIIKKEKIKKGLTIASSIAIGTGVAYACNKLGFSDSICKTTINVNGFLFGKGARNFYNFLYNSGLEYVVDGEIGLASAIASYLVMRK